MKALAILSRSHPPRMPAASRSASRTRCRPGTGGAGAARDDDPGAAWHDPAALADGGGWRVGLSLALARPSLEARAARRLVGAVERCDLVDATAPRSQLRARSVGRRHRGRRAVRRRRGLARDVAGPARERSSTQLHGASRGAVRRVELRHSCASPPALHADSGRLQLERGLDFIDTQGDVAHRHGRPRLRRRCLRVLRARARSRRSALIYRGRTHAPLHGRANFTAPDAFTDKTPDPGRVDAR